MICSRSRARSLGGEPRRPRPTVRAGTLLALCISFGVLAGVARADVARIGIDGSYGDWGGLAALATDTAGDGGSSGVDFGSLWLADDDRFLFVRFAVGTTIALDENNDLALYLDTDGDGATGLSTAGIGADLEWHFGTRQGTFHGPAGATPVNHDEIRFRAAPTVTAAEFELAIGRESLPDGLNPLFPAPTGPLRLVLLEAAPGGDRLPDTGSITYDLDVGTLPPDTPVGLARELPGDLRIATHNVHFDSPWDPGQEERFGRQWQAVAADVFNFQEIYDHSAADAAAIVSSWVPLPPGESWQAAGNADCKTVSRYPVLGSWPLSGNLAVLLDTSSAIGVELLVVNAHLPCCASDAGRQSEIDEILAFVRDARTPGGTLDLAPGASLLVTGDLNLVGLDQQLTSLITGDIVDEGTYGPDVALDADGSDLTHLTSRQLGLRMGYTWRSDTSTFWPGQLDFLIHADAAMQVVHDFILYTPELTAAELAASGLLADDSLASDHLLFCADYRAPGAPATPFVRGDCNQDGGRNLADAVRLLLVVFLGSPAPDCASACDGDDDGALGVGDAVYALAHLFDGGPPLPPPGPGCAADPTADALDCAAFSACP